MSEPLPWPVTGAPLAREFGALAGRVRPLVPGEPARRLRPPGPPGRTTPGSVRTAFGSRALDLVALAWAYG